MDVISVLLCIISSGPKMEPNPWPGPGHDRTCAARPPRLSRPATSPKTRAKPLPLFFVLLSHSPCTFIPLLTISPFMPLPVAVNGTVSLQGPTRQGDAPQPLTKRAMIIRMSEETLEALAAYPAHPPLQFEFGDTPVRVYTTHSYFFLYFNSCTLPSQPLGYSHRVHFLPNARGPRVHPA